jgi:hypothetical protein
MAKEYNMSSLIEERDRALFRKITKKFRTPSL